MTEDKHILENEIYKKVEEIKKKVKGRAIDYKEINKLIKEIGSIGTWHIVDPFEKILFDSKEELPDSVKIKILDELGNLVDPRTIRIFSRFIKDANKSIRNSVVKGLSLIKHPKCIPPLLDALEDEERWVKIFAIHGLLKNESKKAIKPIIEKLGDEEEQVRLEAMKALEKYNLELIEKPLITSLSSSNRFVKLGAASIIGSKKILEASTELIELLSDEDRRLSIISARSLSKIADPNAIPKLIILALKNEGIDSIYASSIVNMEKPAIKPLIQLYIIANNNEIRNFIGILLSKFGDDAVEIIEEFSNNLDNPDEKLLVQSLHEKLFKN